MHDWLVIRESSYHPTVFSVASLIKHQDGKLFQPARAGPCERSDGGFVSESIHLPTR